jgi:predicted O-linked N-acetylglucosamine transferase (SPINDLY family)
MLGSLAHRAGQLDEAIALIGQAIGIRDEVAVYHFSLGNALLDRGRLDDAAREYRRTLALKPTLAEAHHALGIIHHARGNPAGAAACFERAVALKPDFAEAHTNLGTALRAQGQPDQAVACYRQALALTPDDARTHNNLGSVLTDLGRLDEAAGQYHQALALNPDFAEAHNNLGTVCHRHGRFPEAVTHYRQALALKPDLAEAHDNLATVFRDQGALAEAAAGYRQALTLKPDFAEAHAHLGIVLKEQGRLDEALAALRQAVALKPDSARLRSNLLMALSYSPGIDEAGLTAACRDWGHRHGQPIPGLRHPNRPDPERTLRVGYVSNDLRQHPVGWFLAAVWPAHDPAEVTIHAYSGGVVEDSLTRSLRAAAAVWRDTATLSDAQLAEQIRSDGIDLLVDLDGHTDGTRLPLFALRPAPVQLSWLGHGHTTGLAAIDAILMDAATVPPGSESGFIEEVVRLPGGRLCYAPPAWAPPVAPPPCRTRGMVTFGSFNNLAKVTPQVLGLWARVLAAVPGARLRLRWKSLADDAERTRLCSVFAAAGGDPARLDLFGALPHPALLAAYAEIDIALDPFPFGGGLTTCEALWMGVPVVTWPGPRPMSRQTLGVLTVLGLAGELVADSAEATVALAAGLGADPERLATLRNTLRPRMAASPLCDGARMAQALEATYRRLWRRWAAHDPGPP